MAGTVLKGLIIIKKSWREKEREGGGGGGYARPGQSRQDQARKKEHSFLVKVCLKMSRFISPLFFSRWVFFPRLKIVSLFSLHGRKQKSIIFYYVIIFFRSSSQNEFWDIFFFLILRNFVDCPSGFVLHPAVGMLFLRLVFVQRCWIKNWMSMLYMEFI